MQRREAFPAKETAGVKAWRWKSSTHSEHKGSQCGYRNVKNEGKRWREKQSIIKTKILNAKGSHWHIWSHRETGAGFNKNFPLLSRKESWARQQKIGTGKGGEKPGSWMVAWNSFHQSSDSEDRHVHYLQVFKCGSKFGRRKHWCLPCLSHTVELWSLEHITSPQNVGVFICKSGLAESPRVSSKCYTLWFLQERKMSSYLLEINQVAPGSS